MPTIWNAYLYYRHLVNTLLLNISQCSISFFCFFDNVFSFSFSFFFFFFFLQQQHENIIKSNNKKNNYIIQLLRLPLLKYTHTQKKEIHMIKKKQIKIKAVPTSLPKEKAPLQHPRRSSSWQQSRSRSLQLLSQRPPPQKLQGS